MFTIMYAPRSLTYVDLGTFFMQLREQLRIEHEVVNADIRVSSIEMRTWYSCVVFNV